MDIKRILKIVYNIVHVDDFLSSLPLASFFSGDFGASSDFGVVFELCFFGELGLGEGETLLLFDWLDEVRLFAEGLCLSCLVILLTEGSFTACPWFRTGIWDRVCWSVLAAELLPELTAELDGLDWDWGLGLPAIGVGFTPFFSTPEDFGPSPFVGCTSGTCSCSLPISSSNLSPFHVVWIVSSLYMFIYRSSVNTMLIGPLGGHFTSSNISGTSGFFSASVRLISLRQLAERAYLGVTQDTTTLHPLTPRSILS